jgi:uncharacterized membrane protein
VQTLSDAATETLGPIDYLVVEFPGNKFNGEVLPALVDLIARGLVRVLDLAFVSKDADGAMVVGEVDDIVDGGLLGEISGFLVDLITMEDLESAAEVLEPNSSAAVLIWENTWAAPFVQAVRASKGEVIASGRLAGAEVLAVMSELSTTTS